jgi:hypothetical protein
MGLETKISKLEDAYQLSFKNVKPYGSITNEICNIDLSKKELLYLHKKIKEYITSFE